MQKYIFAYDNRSGSPESPTHEEMMFGSVVKEGMSFNGISILAMVAILFSGTERFV